MKELTLYLNFFRKNLTVIISLALVGAFIGYYLQLGKPTIYKVSRLWEFDNQLLTEQAVTYLRSENLAGKFKLSNGSKVVVHQNGPLSIEVEIEAKSPENLTSTFEKVSEFVKGRFKVEKVGEDVYSEREANIWLGFLVGLAFGASLGILASLMRAYLMNF